MNADRPFFVTDEIATRLNDIFDSHPTDLDAVAEVIYWEFPAEVDRRQAGLAVMWGDKVLQAVSQ